MSQNDCSGVLNPRYYHLFKKECLHVSLIEALLPNLSEDKTRILIIHRCLRQEFDHPYKGNAYICQTLFNNQRQKYLIKVFLNI